MPKFIGNSAYTVYTMTYPIYDSLGRNADPVSFEDLATAIIAMPNCSMISIKTSPKRQYPGYFNGTLSNFMQLFNILDEAGCSHTAQIHPRWHELGLFIVRQDMRAPINLKFDQLDTSRGKHWWGNIDSQLTYADSNVPIREVDFATLVTPVDDLRTDIKVMEHILPYAGMFGAITQLQGGEWMEFPYRIAVKTITDRGKHVTEMREDRANRHIERIQRMLDSHQAALNAHLWFLFQNHSRLTPRPWKLYSYAGLMELPPLLRQQENDYDLHINMYVFCPPGEWVGPKGEDIDDMAQRFISKTGQSALDFERELRFGTREEQMLRLMKTARVLPNSDAKDDPKPAAAKTYTEEDLVKMFDSGQITATQYADLLAKTHRS